MNILQKVQNRLNQQSSPLQAVIREIDCIGCTKCIAACPVDAIIGAAKQMHSIVEAECIGCQLCVEPCPVDCIEMITTEQSNYDPARVHERFQAQQRRIIAAQKNAASEAASLSYRKDYIKEALERVRSRPPKTY
jgi:electron transport complex protein RnfB